MKLNYKKTFLLGFGFFAISITWALYNSYVPIFLGEFITSNAVIGFIMTLDNYAGLFLQPIFGTLSDRTNTKLGKRMPYLIFGMPVAAALVSLVPMSWSLISLVISIVCLNTVMASFRSPTIALMPDITPESLRSKANGIINLMGGIGSIVAFFVGSILYGMNKAYPFYMSSLLIIVSLIVLVLNIKEKRDSLSYYIVPEDKDKLDNEDDDKQKAKLTLNTLFLLLAVFSWFVAYNAVETFFTTYGVKFLNVKVEAASFKFTFFSLAFVVFAIPAGLIATKIGKKLTIIIGISLMIILFSGLPFFSNIDIIGYLFIPAGACWALININSYPFVISMTTSANIGRFTGYYYLFSSLAAIVSPPLIGKLMDIFGYSLLFKYSVVGFIISLIFMILVKSPNNEILKKHTPVEHLENLDM